MVSNQLKQFMAFIGIGLFLGINGCAKPITNFDSHGTEILCFGDSITEGFGVPKGEDYPSRLSRLLNYPVINAGVSGNTTEDGLKRLQEDVLNKDPFLVIVELGANDFLKHVPFEETVSNLEKIISLIQDKGAMVVLVQVKVGVIQDRYLKEFAALAKRYNILLMPDIMKGIMFNPKLKYDGIHPNSEGYRIISERIYKKVFPLIKGRMKN